MNCLSFFILPVHLFAKYRVILGKKASLEIRVLWYVTKYPWKCPSPPLLENMPTLIISAMHT